MDGLLDGVPGWLMRGGVARCARGTVQPGQMASTAFKLGFAARSLRRNVDYMSIECWSCEPVEA